MTTSTRAPEAQASDLVRAADLTLREPARTRRLVATRLATVRRKALARVAGEAERAGMRVHLVGGVVRDLLLRREVRDLDLSVEGDAGALARRLGGVVRSHELFGTASVELAEGVTVDLASTRRERYRRPAALPEVAPAGLAEDLARRDFTVNALAMPLAADGPRGLIDPFGGREDLRGRRLRVLHRGSFSDDPTRAFRAVRLAAELGFTIERETTRLMRADAAYADHLSAARLRREMRHLLESERVGRALPLIGRFGLLATLGAAGRLPRTAEASLGRLPRIVSWFRANFPEETIVVWPPALALLLREPERIGEALTRLQPERGSRRALRDSGEALARIPRALEGRGRLRASRIHAICRGHTTEGLLAVLADTTSSRIRRAVRSYLTSLRAVQPDLTGEDLLQEGLAPGPAVARGLDAALEAKLDGRAANRRAQMRAALEAARRP